MDLENIVGRFRVETLGGGGESFDKSTPEALLEYVQQIENIFSGRLNPSKLDYNLGLVFPDSESEGLLAFLRKTVTDKRYDKSKEQILNLIQYVLVQKAWRTDVNRFCLRFKIAANMYWKHNKVTARLQQAALDCLIALFDNFGRSIDLVDFEASQLFWDLLPRTEKSAYQPTVRAKMFHLLGVLGVLGRDSFMKPEGCFKKVFGHMTETVKAQVVSSDAHLEVSILLGCMKGLDQLLNTYGGEIRAEEDSWIEFQEHLEQIVDPSTSIAKKDGKAKIKRREFQRATLELIANHGEHLKVGLFKKHRQWYNDLLEWSKSSNADDNRIGRRAMYKFLDTVVGHAMVLKESIMEQDENNEGDASALEAEIERFLSFFSEKFKIVLLTKDANRIELGIAVRGYGLMSSICSDQSKTQEMLDLIMQHVNNIIQELESPTVDKYSSSLSILPTYLESVASILPSFKNDADGNTALGQISEDHWESIQRLSVLLIRFYPELSEGQRKFSYISLQKIFDSLWHNHHTMCEAFIEQVYRQSMLHIVSCPTRAEIDILIESYNKSNPDSKKSPYKQLGLKPVTFYVQFWKLLLGRGTGTTTGAHILRFDVLMEWILNTIKKLDLSITFEENDVSEPALDMVQGATANTVKDFQIFVNIVDFFQELFKGEVMIQRKFEKWIPVFANDILAYIKNNTYVSGFYKLLAVVFDAARSVGYFKSNNEEMKILQDKLNIFFKKLGTKIREFRDDLLFGVLELWLSLPDALILSNFSALNSTMQTVFITGRTSFALAIRGLEAIERWFFQPEFPVEEIEIIMNSVFPIWKTYFIHSEIVAEAGAEETDTGAKTTKKKPLKNLIKKNVQFKRSTEDATLKTTQLKILQVIGHFGQYIQLSDTNNSRLSKDQRFLQYAIPFQDCKPELFIDDLLPRVLELCENSVERQTRVSACELLHTIALIFIGRSREKVRERLFRKIFEVMLKLGCDSDIVVRQLFNPLCLQTIHWFSKRNSPYGPFLLEILTENLTQHQDLTLRELAALCVGEYFAWSLKNHYSSRGEPNPNAREVLKTIFALSTHASIDYRQGSVLAFNSVYRDFREDTNLVNEFSFNLLYSFLTSLKLSKDLPEDSLLVTSTKQSLQHLERILVKKKDRFNTAINRQFKPVTNAQGSPCLKHVVEWLLSQGGNSAAVYRDECLRLTKLLAPCVKDFRSTERCLTLWEENHGVEDWIRIAEGNSSKKERIDFLDASSHFYHFLFQFKMLHKSVFSANSRSKFISSLLSLCSQIQPISECTLSEEEMLQVLKIFSRLEYAYGIFDSNTLENIQSCSMELSQNLGSAHSTEVIEALVKVWSFAVTSDSVLSKCRSLLTFDPAEDLSVAKEHSSALKISNQADWFKVIAEGGIMAHMLSEDAKKILVAKLLDSINSALFKQRGSSSGTPVTNVQTNNLSLTEKKIIENYLITAIYIELDPVIIENAIFDATSATQKDGSFQIATTKGVVFQKYLISALVHCETLFSFERLLQERPIKDVGEWIQRILDLMKSDKLLKRRFGETVFKKTITNWKMISINCDMPTSVKIFVGLVAVNMDACKNSEELSTWWNGPNLMQARHLELKQKTGVFGYATVFAQSRNKKIVEALTTTVTDFVENVLKPGGMNWLDVEQYVVHIFKKLLLVFEHIPSNVKLLWPILNVVHKVSSWLSGSMDHQIFRMTRDSLEKTVRILHCADVDRVSLASELYELITSQDRKLLVESVSVWRSSLLPVVSALGLNATKSLFKKYVYAIISTMETQPTTLYDWHRKTLAVNLLELMIYQTSGDFVKSSEVSKAYWDGAPAEKKTDPSKVSDEKTVLRSILKVCADGVTKIPVLADSSMKKCALSCSEACYNTLVATLLETKTDYKFCKGLLFPGKKTFENILDAEQVYEFPVVIDEENSKSRRSLFRRIKIKKNNNNEFSYYGGPTMNFLPRSGNLTGSSLEPEATSYDFTTSVTVENSEFYQRIFGGQANNGKSNAQLNPDGKEDAGSVGGLEWNEINEHSCMFSYVEALKYMAELHRSNKNDGNQQWITSLVKILNDGTVHKNIKIFIVGGFINTPESMEPFAAELIEPIVQLILSDCFGSIELNHFVQDTILTLLSWNENGGSKPKSETVTSLLQYIIRNVRKEDISKRRDVFGHIMEILQNVVKHWVGELNEIPGDYVIALLNGNITDDSATLMLSVSLSILQGGQLPHKNTKDLFEKFRNACSSRFKGVYVTAAKCMGHFLTFAKKSAPENVQEWYLTKVIDKVINGSKSKAPVFVELLSAIQQNFPEIIVPAKTTILELCQHPKIRGELLSLLPLLLKEELDTFVPLDESFGMAISPIRGCGDEFYLDIKGRGFFSMNHPCKSDNELNSGLDLLEILVKNTSNKSDLLDILDWLQSSAEACSNVAIKVKFAECMLHFYRKLMKEAFETSSLDNTVDSKKRRTFFRIFIRLYEDENEEVQAIVQQFWQLVLQEWMQSSGHLLLELFDLIGEEEHPLIVCLGIIAQRCSLAPDYSKNVFQGPLEDCQFLPYQLDTSWRLRHSSFQPLFSESLSSAQNFTTLPKTIQNSLLGQRRSVRRFGMNVLRATLANLQFTPTQQNDADNDSVAGIPMDIDNYTQNFIPEQRDFQVSNFAGNEQRNQSSLGDGSSPSSLQNPILKLRRKFYTRKDTSFYASVESEKRTERKEEARELQLQKISGVKTVRSYRIGELPDILIRHADVIKTLLKLAKLDEKVGQSFVLHLYRGMIKEMDPSGRRKFISKSKDVFDRVLRNSTTASDRLLPGLMVEMALWNNISIPLIVILDVCKITHTQKLGILKLEKQLQNEDSAEEGGTVQKRSKLPVPPNSNEVNMWLGLAEMHKEIEEYDGLRNIFEHVCQCPLVNPEGKELYQKVGTALYLEGKGHLDKALELFDKALDNENENEAGNLTTKYFLEDSMLNCLTRLGDWDTLLKSSVNFRSTLAEDILQDQNAIERLIPSQMLAGLHLLLRDADSEDGEETDDERERKENVRKFSEFVQNTLESEEGTSFMSTRYPFEAAAWLLIERETQKRAEESMVADYIPYVNIMLEKGYELAIRLLKNVDGLSLKIQKQIIVSLQQSSAIYDYLKWSKIYEEKSVIEARTTGLIGNWRKHLTYRPMDLVGTDYVCANRDYFLTCFGLEIEKVSASNEELLQQIQDVRVRQDIWLANLGIFHKNFYTAQSALMRLRQTGREDLSVIEFRKSMARFLAAFSRHLDRDDWCKRWCSVWKKMDKISSNNESADVTAIKVDLLYCALEAEDPQSSSSFAPIIKILNGSTTALTACILKSTEQLISSCEADYSSLPPSCENGVLYLKLFHLLKKLASNCSIGDDSVGTKMISCLLRGCTEGSAHEILQLSNVFSLLKKSPGTLNAAFEEMSANVPVYLFLPWIDQIMTAYKSFPEQYKSFKCVIDRLLKEYPQAFHLQYPEYSSSNQKLFAKALKAVVLPIKLHEVQVVKVLTTRREQNLVKNLTEFQETLQEVINNDSMIYGEYHTDYATELFDVVNKTLMEYNRSSQSSSSQPPSQPDALSPLLRKCKEKVDEIYQNYIGKFKKAEYIGLEKLSPFLAEFHFFEHESVEKPGLYENFKRPRVQDHPLIVSFHPTVKVYSSITRPMQLTVFTNDGKKSNFLAKHGDDIRQDRRIQQLFKISNILFRGDACITQRKLHVETYSCIPLASDFGLIEMVDNVMSLADVLFEDQDIKALRTSTIQEYEAWMWRSSKIDPKSGNLGYLHYRTSAKIVGREECERFYNQLSLKLPKFLLRDNIQKRSSNLQEFFSIRQDMIKSYGAMCMVHWLLGIGDRHLENCLLSMDTGRLVGIDFGRAFGTSNYVIPVPELVPFRMTPQLQNFMLPYTFRGLFRESCILTWNCLLEASDLLLTVAEVFIQEPSIDWLKLRQGTKSVQNQDVSNNAQEHSCSDAPFEILKKKLANYNPTKLVLEELRMHSIKDITGIYSKVVDNGRVHLEISTLSTEEYIDVLINLATDKNVLGRMFNGWNSWI